MDHHEIRKGSPRARAISEVEYQQKSFVGENLLSDTTTDQQCETEKKKRQILCSYTAFKIVRGGVGRNLMSVDQKYSNVQSRSPCRIAWQSADGSPRTKVYFFK